MSNIRKMKKSATGRFGEITETVDDYSGATIYDYKVHVALEHGNPLYIWWRVTEKDGIYTLRHLEGNNGHLFRQNYGTPTYSTIDEAISTADAFTDETCNVMNAQLFDAGWSDEDIASYNNFGDSIKSTKKSFSQQVAKQRAKNNNVVKGDKWRRTMRDYFGQYIIASSSENDFEILIDKIRTGTPEEVIEQCKRIKGMMDVMISTMRTETGVW